MSTMVEQLARSVDIPPEITSRHTVPQMTVLLVEGLLHVGCHVLSHGVLLQCLVRSHRGVMQHLLGHAEALDHHAALPLCFPSSQRFGIAPPSLPAAYVL